MNESKVVGLTGGVGSGKTFVAVHAHEKYGVPILLADEVGHIALEPGRITYEKVVDAFGMGILRQDGSINRNILGNEVFADAEKRKILNGIVHPFIESYIKEQLKILKAETKERYILLESAILFESKLDVLCDEVWFVMADETIRKERLRISRGYTDQKTEGIMKAQLSEKEARKRADKILINNGNLQEIEKQLENILVK